MAKIKLEEAEAMYDIARGDLDNATEELQEAQRAYELFLKESKPLKKARIHKT